jgi:septum formation protein
MPPLILASTSRYRAELLARLRIPFEVRAPGVDESPLHGEAPSALAARLALSKARAVAFKDGQALVIGSDQVAHCAGEVLGKPGNHESAIRQLQLMRGKTTYFDTALALVNAATGREQSTIVTTSVVMRHASDEEIEAYVRLDQPFDCAGSARSEGLGIVLMERIDGDDPTALVGLPLIALVRMLRAENHPLLPTT